MVSPHYITQRVGDEYVLVRVDPVGHAGRMLAGGLGVSMLLNSVRRGGVFACIEAALASGLLYHAATGRNPLNLLRGKECAKRGEHKDSPSFPGEEHNTGQLPSDAIEEASMESFPASDPPATMRPTGTR
jgi:hypothetical protein